MGSVTISTCVGWIVSPERHVAAQPLSSQPLLHVISHPSALRMNHPVGLTCVSHLAPCKDFRKLRILGNFLLFAERFTCFIFSRLIEMFLESVSNLRAQHTASLNMGSSGPTQKGGHTSWVQASYKPNCLHPNCVHFPTLGGQQLHHIPAGVLSSRLL